MDFSEALRAVLDGKRARRAMWAQTHLLDAWLECADLHADGSSHTERALLVSYADGTWHLFAGANWDLLAHDWEIM